MSAVQEEHETAGARKPHAERKRVVAACVLALAAAFAVACAVRIQAVNAAYPEHNYISYAMGEAVPLTDKSHSSDPTDVTIEVTSCALVDGEDIAQTLGFTDPVTVDGDASEVTWLVVFLDLANNGIETSTASLTSLAAQSGSWASGPDMIAKTVVGDEARALYELWPGQRASTVMVFSLYDNSFTFTDKWEKRWSWEYELVLSVYPDKVSIDLGVPERVDAARIAEMVEGA